MLETLWEIAKELGITPPVAGLYLFVYLLGAKLEIFPKPRWMNGRKNGNGALGEKMDTLTAHFNEETTGALKTLADNQQKIIRGQNDIKNAVDNIHKFGVKIRK